MKKLFLFAVAATFAVATVASTPGDDKKKNTKCENKAACCKTAKAEASAKEEKKCCKGDAAKCSDKKAESSAAKAEEKK